MGRWYCILVVFAALLVPPVSAQPGVAELETDLSPQRITVSVEEDRMIELRIDARVQCIPGHRPPRDLQGYFTREGFRRSPVYWALDPPGIKVPWHEQENALWVINETFSFLLHADAPASERLAGDQETVFFISGGRTLDVRDCTPAGHEWDTQIHPLTVVVPATEMEDEEGSATAPFSGYPLGMPLSALAVFFMVVLSTYLIGRWERHRRS